MLTSKTISLPQYRIAGEVAVYVRSCISNSDTKQLSIDSLCRKFAMSETVLARIFKRRHGTTIHAFVIHHKMLHAKSLLRDETLPIKVIAWKIGYSELSNFSRDFSRITGMSPNAFRLCRTCLAEPLEEVVIGK